MPRKLKTFVTTLGFFERAVAAPSMKAALDAWGVTQNLFHDGFAKEVDDPAIVSAATARPGTVMKRAVGSKGRFTENPELPESLPAKALPPSGRTQKKDRKRKPSPQTEPDKGTVQAQLAAFEKTRAGRDIERTKERQRQSAAKARASEKRQKNVEKAQLLFDEALERHQAKIGALENEKRATILKIESEAKRWSVEQKKFERRLRQARR